MLARQKPAPTQKTDVNSDKTITTAREWTGRPYDKPGWFFSNQKTLFDEVDGSREFITCGIVVSDRKVSVKNIMHAQAYMNGTIVRGTLQNPFDVSSLPAVCTDVIQPAAVGTPAIVVGAPPALPTMITPTSLAELGPDAARFQIAPEICEGMEQDILRHWTDQILDKSLRIETVELHSNKGTVFIRQTEEEMNRPDSSKNAAASARAAEMRNHRFGHEIMGRFINADQDFNATLVGTPKFEDEEQRAVAYDEVLMEHSKEIHTLITVERNRLLTEGLLSVPPVRLSNYRVHVTATHNEFAKAETAELRREIKGG